MRYRSLERGPALDGRASLLSGCPHWPVIKGARPGRDGGGGGAVTGNNQQSNNIDHIVYQTYTNCICMIYNVYICIPHGISHIHIFSNVYHIIVSQ